MKTAIYPGSFNPWHSGHDDVLNKALLVFDKVIIAIGQNPDKPVNPESLKDVRFYSGCELSQENYDKTTVEVFSGLLVDYIGKLKSEGIVVDAVIRGLRNAQDFEMEKTQQYHNEDLGLVVPVYYVVSDRNLVHISSSAIRMIEKARKA